MLFDHIVQLVALVWMGTMGTMWSPGVSNSGVGGGGGCDDGGGVTVDGVDVDDVLFRSARTSYSTFDPVPPVPSCKKNPDHLYSLINH